LDLWLNPLLDLATSASDFDLRDLRKKKMAIYLGIKPRDFERLQVVMNVFFQQAIGEQTAELPEINPELKYQLLVALDEFTAVGRIPIMLNSIAFIPGYNVRPLTVIQTPSQLDEVYGQNGRKILLKTLAARIVFPPNDMEDARNISEELGYTTTKSSSRTTPSLMAGSKRGPSTSVTDQRRALMLPQEIKEMPADQQLLFVEHVLPVRCHKIKYFKDPIFKERLLPPPGVEKHDVAKYSGARTDDHFAMWQERINRDDRAAVPPASPSGVAPAPEPEPIARRSAQAAGEVFPLDFSHVRIPPGRYLSASELAVAVDTFLDEYEAA
jgi:type IV secretion system protein VirD4